MKQQSLFGNLPTLNSRMKDVNKNIIKKANNPTARRTVTTRGARPKAIQSKVAAIVEMAKSKLIDNGTTQLITKEEELKKYIDAVIMNGTASIDTETTGLDPIEDKLVGIGIYTEGMNPVYIPIWHTDFNGNSVADNMKAEFVREQLQKCIDSGVGFIMHNAKFDMRVLKNQLQMSEYIKCKWDTHLAANLLNENESHGLKPLWNKYVNRGQEDDAESFDKLFDKVPFNYVPLDIAKVYAANDPKITYELYKFQKQFLDVNSPLCKEKELEGAAYILQEVETPIIKYICEMEDAGIGIDEKVAKDLSDKYHALLDEAEQRVQQEISKIDLSRLSAEQKSKLSNPVNASSPQQLAIILYDALGLQSPDKRKPRGTGEDILERMIEKYPEHKELMKSILDLRGFKKLVSTYIDKLPSLVKESTGKLHTQFNQYGAKTGRFSSSDPNLQNIPSRNKEIRTMFIPSKDFVLISADYSQQEPRVLAHLCYQLFNDSKMRDAYLEERDLYSWMASQIYQVPYEECHEKYADGTLNPKGKERRDSVKSIILGLMYGRQTKSIAEQIGKSVQETEQITEMFFMNFPAIRLVMEHYKEMARTKGYIQTVYGRKRRLPDYNLPDYEILDANSRQPLQDKSVVQYYLSQLKNAWGREKNEIISEARKRGVWIVDNVMKKADAERQTLNSVVQGSSADITKKAMKALGEHKQLRELGYRMLLQVHDEIIGESPRETAKQCGEIVCEVMAKVTEDTISVPMKVDAEYTERWFGEDISDKL